MVTAEKLDVSGMLSDKTFKDLAQATWRERFQGCPESIPTLPSVADVQGAIIAGDIHDDAYREFFECCRAFDELKLKIEVWLGSIGTDTVDTKIFGAFTEIIRFSGTSAIANVSVITNASASQNKWGAQVRVGDSEISWETILQFFKEAKPNLFTAPDPEIDTEGIQKAFHQILTALTLGLAHNAWLKRRASGKVLKHPVVPIVASWFEEQVRRKPPGRPRDYGAGFLPSRMAAHERDQKFGLPSRIDEKDVGGTKVLPEFGSERRMPSLPEEFLRLGQVTRGGGHGAHLAIRATLAGIEYAPPDRESGLFYAIPVREFLGRIYPTEFPRGRRWYEALARVAEIQAAARVPYIEPNTGVSGTTIPILLYRIPHSLDGDLSIAVDLPPSSDYGPPITDSLFYYGARNPRAFYALLQLAVDWWQPGRTRVPVSKRPGVWMQLTDSEKSAHVGRYAPYDRKQIVYLTAPLTTQRSQRLAYQRALETLNALHEAGVIVLLPDGRDTFRILPPPPPSIL